MEMWECHCDIDVKKMKIETNRPNLEHHKFKPLLPSYAYFGGQVNAVKLYYKCIGDKIIRYLDITSMYTYVMFYPKYYFPTHQYCILKAGKHIAIL